MHELYFGVNTIDMELDIKTKKIDEVVITTLADSEGSEVFTIEPPEGASTSSSSGGGSGGSGSGSGGSGIGTGSTLKLTLSRVTKDDADKIAEAMLSHNNSGLSGNITLIGSPQIRVGDGIKLKGHIFGKKPFARIETAESEYDASVSTEEQGSEEGGGSGGGGEETTFKVMGIRHLFNDKLGFVTKLTVIEEEPHPPEEAEGAEEEEEEEEEEEGVEEEEEEEEEEEPELEEILYTGLLGDFEGIFVLGKEDGEPLEGHKFTLVYPEDKKERYKADDEGEVKFEEIEIPSEENPYQIVADDLPHTKRKLNKYKFKEATK
jgi:hypothetical protein